MFWGYSDNRDTVPVFQGALRSKGNKQVKRQCTEETDVVELCKRLCSGPRQVREGSEQR